MRRPSQTSETYGTMNFIISITMNIEQRRGIAVTAKVSKYIQSEKWAHVNINGLCHNHNIVQKKTDIFIVVVVVVVVALFNFYTYFNRISNSNRNDILTFALQFGTLHVHACTHC